MICRSCKKQRHEDCVGAGADEPGKPPTGLSPEGDKVQRSGLCPCHHRVSDIEKTNAKIRTAIEIESMIQVGSVSESC